MRSRSGTWIGVAAVLVLCMSLAVRAQNVQTFSTTFDTYTTNNVKVLGNGLVQLVLDQASGKPPRLCVAGSTMYLHRLVLCNLGQVEGHVWKTSRWRIPFLDSASLA
jgi:hypothetical protein